MGEAEGKTTIRTKSDRQPKSTTHACVLTSGDKTGVIPKMPTIAAQSED